MPTARHGNSWFFHADPVEATSPTDSTHLRICGRSPKDSVEAPVYRSSVALLLASFVASLPAQSVKPTDLTVTQTQLVDESGVLYVSGTARTLGGMKIREASVKIDLFDTRGRRVGSMTAHASNIEAGSTWRFRAPIGVSGVVGYKITDIKFYR